MIFEKYIDLIKKATKVDELKEISYKALIDLPNRNITPAQENIISDLCFWKQQQVRGATPSELNDCMHQCKIAKKYINLIK